MKFSLPINDQNKLEALFTQHEKNIDYLIAVSQLISRDVCLIKQEEELSLKGKSDFDKLNFALDRLEFDYNFNPDIVNKHLRWDTKIISADDFSANPYLKTIKNVAFEKDNWKLSSIIRKPYTIVPYQEEYAFGSNYALKLSLAVFDKEYVYPSISLYDNEWMSLNQHEIRTMEIPIALAKGKVLTLGLGLGYFAFMASNKEEVKEVHIVEMDHELINLFDEYLLPLFPHKEKIHIHKADAFYFINNIQDKDYDYIFSDLWHDVSDGVPAYLKLKKKFKEFTHTTCTYWIENSLISYLRMLVIGVMKDEYYRYDNEYDERQLMIKEKLKDYSFKHVDDIDSLLNLKGLNHLFFD